MAVITQHVRGAKIGQPAERIDGKLLEPGNTNASLPEDDLKERPNAHQAQEDHHDDVVYLGDSGIQFDQAVIHTIPTFLLDSKGSVQAVACTLPAKTISLFLIRVQYLHEG